MEITNVLLSSAHSTVESDRQHFIMNVKYPPPPTHPPQRIRSPTGEPLPHCLPFLPLPIGCGLNATSLCST